MEMSNPMKSRKLDLSVKISDDHTRSCLYVYHGVAVVLSSLEN